MNIFKLPEYIRIIEGTDAGITAFLTLGFIGIMLVVTIVIFLHEIRSDEDEAIYFYLIPATITILMTVWFYFYGNSLVDTEIDAETYIVEEEYLKSLSGAETKRLSDQAKARVIFKMRAAFSECLRSDNKVTKYEFLKYKEANRLIIKEEVEKEEQKSMTARERQVDELKERILKGR